MQKGILSDNFPNKSPTFIRIRADFMAITAFSSLPLGVSVPVYGGEGAGQSGGDGVGQKNNNGIVMPH